MSRPAPTPAAEPNDEDEVFQQFGIEDDDDKHRVKVLAAARELARRKAAKANPPAAPAQRNNPRWGEE